MFTKEERSSFSYWFAHWCAFQMTALNHKMWRPKYLFHDCEKPWLRLIFPYKKVQKLHRHHHNHHFEWLNDKLSKYVYKYSTLKDLSEVKKVLNKYDWNAMIIDWECDRFTKIASQLTARERVQNMFKLKNLVKYPNILKWFELVRERVDNVIDKYNF